MINDKEPKKMKWRRSCCSHESFIKGVVFPESELIISDEGFI